jgi:hypothetical protein
VPQGEIANIFPSRIRHYEPLKLALNAGVFTGAKEECFSKTPVPCFTKEFVMHPSNTLTVKRIVLGLALLLVALPGTASAEIFQKNVLTTASPVSINRPGCYSHIYTVNLQAGVTYTIDLRSTNFDAFLHLGDNVGRVLAWDDDSGGGLDARIVFTAPYTGQYKIMATTFRPGETGAYTLLVRP